MEFDKEFFGNSPRQHFIGVVEDNDDPLRCGRVRVRVFATHADDKKLLPTSTLRWMTIRTGVTGPYCHVGISTVLRQGTWVEGYWADGGLKQLGVITDVIPGVESATANTAAGFNDPAGVYPNVTGSDFHPLAQGNVECFAVTDRQEQRTTAVPIAGGGTWDQPEIDPAPSYGNNFVIATPAGHVIELDSSEQPRVHIFHGNGSFIEMTNHSTVVVSKGKKFVVISSDHNIYASNNVNVTADGTATVKAPTIRIEGAVMITGDVTITGGVTASGDVVGSGVSLASHTHGQGKDSRGDSQADTDEPN